MPPLLESAYPCEVTEGVEVQDLLHEDGIHVLHETVPIDSMAGRSHVNNGMSFASRRACTVKTTPLPPRTNTVGNPAAAAAPSIADHRER
ncbi:hypothetical protein E2562_031954 [Oryza meyeriana var. granulata]|uniref:Uncharacterized protein n=1 Tax=Oryza meyeriana var. granulata TaxID=110450 RepID=A0A6G1ERU1_9ORYZ|nr:hypothetical protein E2562_031954 [Oryza meyeriana var. granulata]